MKAVYEAFSKINLMLDIITRLPNGYHSLFMLMQSVSLSDRITVETNSSGNTELACSQRLIPTDKSNIAYKAADAFFDYTKIKNTGLKINIEKNIPFSAGLAGGSADGAAVIQALDDIYATSLSDYQKNRIGIKVGADVPFCLTGGTRLAQNTGDILSPLPDMKNCYIVLCKPDMGVSTKKAYDAFDQNKNLRHLDCAGILYAASLGDYEAVCAKIGNVFEQLVEVPERVKIKSVMNAFKAKATCMSGSGPTVFGVFLNKSDAQKACEKLKLKYAQTFLCEPVSSGLRKIL